ncbi:MAG: HAMP domain-containing sensor histidine kinase [Deltaproteobacteria bacterium]|nr:HAMP domain-containing sensor histidine kinase [Deltaproteobacteria bacterium]
MFSSVRARITLAMASLVALLALASAVAVREVMLLEALSQQVAEIDAATSSLHRLAIAMRDAYAHQAHVVITDDRSHLDHYGETHAAALRAVVAARATLKDPGDLVELEGIARVVVDLDTSFRTDLLPLIASASPQRAAAHDKAIHLVEHAQGAADKLTRRLDARAADIRTAVQASRERLFGRCALLLAAALLLAVVVTALLDRQVSVPVRRLEAAVRRLGDGDLSTRVRADGDDELASLARHFNEMASELQEREHKLLEAERLAGIGRLAAGVAHEINNPLGVMLGYVHLIERSDDDGVKADAAMVRAEIARCQQIVAGLLDLARPPRLTLDDVDLIAVARDAAQPLGALPDGRPRVLVRALRPAEPCIAIADEGKVLQILRNLYDNAVDADPDRPVEVELVRVGGAVQIAVIDHGGGLTAEAKARLFEPFFTNKPKGTGLGLAVSRTFAEAQGGTLELVDAAVDVGAAGARFVLTLPRTQDRS